MMRSNRRRRFTALHEYSAAAASLFLDVPGGLPIVGGLVSPPSVQQALVFVIQSHGMGKLTSKLSVFLSLLLLPKEDQPCSGRWDPSGYVAASLLPDSC